MGLFDEIARAIDDPNQRGNSNQIGTILNLVQQASGNQGVNPSTTQAMLSVVGSHVRSALQEQRSVGGSDRVESIVEQYGGTNADPRAVQSLFTPEQQHSVIQDVARRTGINSGTIQAMLPVLVPLVLNLLQSGARNHSQGNYQSQQGNYQTDRDDYQANQGSYQANQGGYQPNQRTQPTSNSVLNMFLDADNDGAVDVGDAISIAGRFLNQRR